MKMFKYFFFGLLFLSFSCKKEKPSNSLAESIVLSDKELLNKIDESFNVGYVDSLVFANNINPLIKQLIAKDSIKYFMLKHIALKASEQSNPMVLVMNIDDVKNELNSIKDELK